MKDFDIELFRQSEIDLPKSKGEKKQLKRAVLSATPETPLAIYVGSCPDYSHQNGLYTHEKLNEGVPLLTQHHLNAASPLLRALDLNGIAYRYTVMIADVEATDPYFCQKFAKGDEQKFLSILQSSIAATTVSMEILRTNQGLQGDLISSSFFHEFGKVQFMDLQTAYQTVLNNRRETDSSFRGRLTDENLSRANLYNTMYPEVMSDRSKPDAEISEFLSHRTIRTMAQYLALGRLIGAVPNAVIINHPTRNLGMFNDRNRFPLPDDGTQPQPTVPILHMTKEVYK